MRDVYAIGACSTVTKTHPGMRLVDLAREAYSGTLHHAGMKTGGDIETGWLGAAAVLAEEGGGASGMEEAIASVVILHRNHS